MRRMRRSGSLLPFRPARGRLLVGVCAGLAGKLGLDPTLLRLAFLVLIAAWGSGLVLYFALWLLMPDESDFGQNIDAATALRRKFALLMREASRSPLHARSIWDRIDSPSWPRPLGRRWLALGLVVAGVLLVLGSFGAFGWIDPARGWGIAALAVGAGIILTMRS